MSYLFDSDICIDLLRGRESTILESIRKKYGMLGSLDCLTSVVVEGELWVGVHKAPNSAGLKTKLENLLSSLSVLPIDREVAQKYAEIRVDLERKGNRIGANDLFIAATALTYDLTLLTRNQREYARIPNLKIATY